VSTTETQKSVDSNGDEYDSTKSTYGGVNGSASQSATTTTLQPGASQSALPEVVTTKKTSTTSTSY